MRVLVTGGTGFVGSFTAAHFAERGHEVVCFDRKIQPSPELEAVGTRVSLVEGDVLNGKKLLETVKAHGIEGIVHAAAVISQGAGAADPMATYRINVDGTMAVLETVRAAGLRMVYVSTATLYGIHPDLPLHKEDDRIDPVGIYDTTKLMAETMAITYHKVYKLDIAAIRPGYIYGPRNSTGGYFLDRLYAGEEVEQPVGGDLPMDVTYVKDVALGIYLAMTVRPIRHRLFNITGGIQRRRGEVAELAGKLLPGARIHLGPGVPPTAHLRGPSDLTRAREELGYAPQYTLETGMAEWLDWLRRHAQPGK